MLFCTMLRRPAAKTLALIALATTAATANAADVSVSDAKIEGGKLVITGTTAAPNTWVRLDGQTSSPSTSSPGLTGRSVLASSIIRATASSECRS